MKRSIMKRMTAGALMISMAFGLAACGQKGQDNPSSADSPQTESAVSTDAEPESEVSSEAETASNQGEVLEVHVGDFLGETFLYPVKLAAELGMFEEEFAKDNIKICVDYLGSGAVMNEALTAGDLQMSFLGGQPTYSGIANIGRAHV